MAIKTISSGTVTRFFVNAMIEAGDAETQTVHIFARPGRVISVMFDTEAALGASLSVDLVDGGSSGTGTTVIQASTDNLNGAEEKVISTPYEMADGNHLNVTVDNIVTGTTVRLSILCEEFWN